MKQFYEKTGKLDELSRIEKPVREDLDKLLETISYDNELAVYFYNHCKNGEWIPLLKEAGEFKDLEAKEVTRLDQIKAIYISEVAEEKPKEVLDIILYSDAKDVLIRSRFLDVILKKPVEYINEGTVIIKKYLDGSNYKHWHFVGEPSAKFMAAIAEVDIDKAFDVAKMLLEVWKREKKEVLSKDIEAKFKAHEYKDLVFKYYKKMWEADGIRAGKQLAGIFDNYLKELGEDDYSVQSGFYIKLERLDQIEEKFKRDIIAIVVGGICEAGRKIIEKQADKIDELLDYLNGLDKTIFERILMYLLRFVPAGTQKERISIIIGNKKFLELPYWQYEYRLLLRDKYEDVTEEAKEFFVKWVKGQRVDDIDYFAEWFERTRGRKHTQEDLERYENRIRASKLFLVREKFTDLYEGYKNKSGLSDGALAPGRMVSEAHFVSPEEGSQYSSEKMGKDNVEIVVNYLLEPKNYEGKDKVSGWGTAKDALAASFKADVKKRPMEYLNVDFKKLERLDPEFLEKLLYGVSEAVRDGSFKKEGWGDLIEIAREVVQRKHMDGGYKNCFSAILSTLRDGFTEKDNAIEFDNKKVGNLWFILATLLNYDEDYEISSYERDPIQMRCTSVNGEALEQVLMLGVACKTDFKEYYEEHLKSEIRKLLDYVVRDVKRPEVNCTLGIDLGKIGWLDEEWLKENVEKVFEGEMWDVVWGTHVSWGRPSRSSFELLKERGIYKNATEKLGTPNKYEFGKDPEEGFVEHLMIGYFNEWVEFEDELLKKFFEKASAKLRGKAACFLTTGFKEVNEEVGEEKNKAATRMKKYWEKRLEKMRENPEENFDEAVEFTEWVEDTLLEPKETLELLKQTLELSGGKFGQMRDAEEFVEGVCELGKGNELIALRCLKKAVADENMREPWAGYEEKLVGFLEQISKLPNDYENVEDILNEAVEMADLYGRLQPDKFREIWEKLNKRLRESKV